MVKKSASNSTASELDSTRNLAAERASVLSSIADEIVDNEEARQLLENYDETTINAIETRIDLQIKLEKKLRRKKWDKTLLLLVIIGFSASYILVILIGLGILKFGDNAFAVPSVVAAGVIQTYGLAKVAAEYFFSDDKKTKK